MLKNCIQCWHKNEKFSVLQPNCSQFFNNINYEKKIKPDFKKLRCENDMKHCERTSAYNTDYEVLENETGNSVRTTDWIIKSKKRH